MDKKEKFLTTIIEENIETLSIIFKSKIIKDKSKHIQYSVKSNIERMCIQEQLENQAYLLSKKRQFDTYATKLGWEKFVPIEQHLDDYEKGEVVPHQLVLTKKGEEILNKYKSL